MLADEALVAIEEQCGAVERAAIALQTADHHEQPGRGASLCDQRDLGAGSVLPDAVKQLADALMTCQHETGRRYVGILTDGADWRCFALPEAEGGPPREVSARKLAYTKPDVES